MSVVSRQLRKNVSRINHFLRYTDWVSSPGKNFASLSESTFQKPTRLTSYRKPKVSLHFCDRNSSSNRRFERATRYVNKSAMSSSTSTPNHTKSTSPNNESDDISLTFWIFLWSLLAIVASWIYTKLNTTRGSDVIFEENTENLHGQQADEQIARKLVKEITKNDLVKRSTFRRQRSYEIIDGEVRIYYDVAYGYEDTTLSQTKNYGENIIENAEVDNFPIRRNSMDDLELIFPGHLPGIIEEGEELIEDEHEEVLVKAQVPMMSCGTLSKDDDSKLPVVKIVDYDRELSNNLNSQDDVGMKQHEADESNVVDKAMDNGLSQQPPEVDQTNIAGSTEEGRDEGRDGYENAQVGNTSFFRNSDNSSSDEISSQESIIDEENVSRLAEKAVHASNSIPTLVYKLTEVTPRDGGSFTVIRKEVRKPNNVQEKDLEFERATECLQTQGLSSNTTQEGEECGEYVKQLDKTLPQSCEVVKADISCQDGTNKASDVNNDDVLISSCNNEQDTETVREQCREDNITEKTTNGQENTCIHEVEISKESLILDRKLHDNTSLDQVGKVDDYQVEILDSQHDGFFNSDIECNISGNVLLTENNEEGLCKFNPLEDGSDIFIDDSGDLLFKVIGPSEVNVLAHIDEAEEYLVAENVKEQLSMDENSNYKSKTEYTKNWKSLETHPIHHSEVDRDVDDFNVESDEREHYSDQENIIKSEDGIPLMIETIPDGSHLEYAEVCKESSELQLDIQEVTDSTEHFRMDFAYKIPNTSQVILAETAEKVCQAEPDPMLANHVNLQDNVKFASEEFPNTIQHAAEEGMMKDPEEVTVFKAKIENEKARPINTNISETIDTSTQICMEAVSIEHDASITETFQANRDLTHESATDVLRNNDEDSDEEIIVACLSVKNEEVAVSKVIYASEVAEEKVRSSSYHSAQVLSHENYETKKFQETSLDTVPLTSSPVTLLKEELVMSHDAVFDEGTDVDNVSDVDEIDIDNIEPEEKEHKSKSVTDLDQALASYSGSEYNTSGGMMDDDTNGLSKSVPDILDSCREESLKEATVRTNSNNSIDSLTENLPKKNISLSTPEIGALPSTEGLKKVTKIKIIHVKFLEMQNESGSENIEECFTVEGDVPMSGKMKRRSGNFTDVSLPTEKPLNQVDEYFTAEKVKQKELEFGFDELFKEFPPSPPPTQTTSSATAQRQLSSSVLQDERTRSSTESLPENEKYIATYGVIKSHSSTATDHFPQGMKLSEKFHVSQDATREHNKKTSSSITEFKYNNESKKISKADYHLVRIKSGVINDYECSSDADSEMSYNTPSPRPRTRKIHRVLTHNKSIDSASSSEPDSPRRRERTKDETPTMSQIFGIQSNNTQNLEPVKEKIFERNPKLFSRFGHLQQSRDSKINERYSRQQEFVTQRNTRQSYQSSDTTLDGVILSGPNRSMEFNPFADIDGYDFDVPFERSQSPTSISSDQSSVFSFNCDFEPMPSPTCSFNPEVYTCDNPTCRKQDILLGPEKTIYKSCPACFTYYCSSECRKLHWPVHKQSCYFGRVNTYVRSIIRLCQRRQDLSMYLSQLARDGYNKKGRGVVMATFNSPELAREFITKGHDAFSGKTPTYSSLSELNHEGVISKHRVALMQAVRDYEPNDEFVFNIAIVAIHDIPITPAPRYKLNTILHCIKMALNESIVAHQPKDYGKVETRLFALPKCARHEFVNEMEARRHYCRNLSKNLRQYNIKLKEDYQECYKKLCMYVEHDIAFEPMTLYGQRNGLTYRCILAPEQNYPLNPEYC